MKTRIKKSITLLAIVLALSGCVVAGVQARTAKNAKGENVRQVRPCLYFFLCTPWSDPSNLDPKDDKVDYTYPSARQ